jgi:hypothetical protein
MKYKTTFQVHGSGRFPLDMLRYDCCFPDCSTDISMLSNECRDDRIVTLVRHHETKDPNLTVGRWNSFGWGVYLTRTEKL